MRFLFFLAAACAAQPPAANLLVKPYLQLGEKPGGLAVVWHTRVAAASWTFEYKAGQVWKASPAMLDHKIPKRNYFVYSASLSGVAPGAPFDYRLRSGDETVFAATAQAPPLASKPFRFLFVGDGGDGGPAARRIAYQAALTHRESPFSLAVLGGDLAYTCGGINDYLENFYPLYNADAEGAASGGSLMRSMTFAGAIGNHDAAMVPVLCMRAPDLAYFYFWKQPANGPAAVAMNPKKAKRKPGGAFPESAAVGYPSRANFSFDWGAAHFTVLDSNEYVDWTAPAMQAWVEADLKSAAKAAWRIVVFHHAPFQSSGRHQGDQWMRVLSPIFERHGVRVVLTGHVHNYQRSRPITFAAVEGSCKADAAKGIVYVVSGGGGHDLVRDHGAGDECTANAAFQAGESFTAVEVSPSALVFEQIDGEGKRVDQWRIGK